MSFPKAESHPVRLPYVAQWNGRFTEWALCPKVPFLNHTCKCMHSYCTPVRTVYCIVCLKERFSISFVLVVGFIKPPWEGDFGTVTKIRNFLVLIFEVGLVHAEEAQNVFFLGARLKKWFELVSSLLAGPKYFFWNFYSWVMFVCYKKDK